MPRSRRKHTDRLRPLDRQSLARRNGHRLANIRAECDPWNARQGQRVGKRAVRGLAVIPVGTDARGFARRHASIRRQPDDEGIRVSLERVAPRQHPAHRQTIGRDDRLTGGILRRLEPEMRDRDIACSAIECGRGAGLHRTDLDQGDDPTLLPEPERFDGILIRTEPSGDVADRDGGSGLRRPHRRQHPAHRQGQDAGYSPAFSVVCRG